MNIDYAKTLFSSHNRRVAPTAFISLIRGEPSPVFKATLESISTKGGKL